MNDCVIEREFFRMFNRLVEPRVRAGWGSPRLVPGGVIVLETTGRKSGRRHRTPLAAVRVQGHTVVSTFRGARSQWVKNAAADPRVRYWLRGRARNALASVVADGLTPGHDEFPRTLRWLLPFMIPYTQAGWAFAVLTPDVSKRKTRSNER